MDERFDYIVVGAGSAGCGARGPAQRSAAGSASSCSRRAGRTRNPWIHIPLGVGKLLTNERYAWKFETEPQEELKGQKVYWPRGRVLGGSSALNGMAYVWGDPREYDGWREAGLAGWGFSDLLPYFQRLENNPYSRDARRGHAGPVRITDRQAARPRRALGRLRARRAAARASPRRPTTTSTSYEGVRYLEQTAHRGRRWSTAVAYLRGARKRPNLRIETEAVVSRVLFEGVAATGVRVPLRRRSRGARPPRAR